MGSRSSSLCAKVAVACRAVIHQELHFPSTTRHLSEDNKAEERENRSAPGLSPVFTSCCSLVVRGAPVLVGTSSELAGPELLSAR